MMVSRSDTARPLLAPGEVMQLPSADEIVMISGTPPIRAKKARYFENGRFAELVLPPRGPSSLPINSHQFDLRRRLAVITAGVGFDDAGIDGKAFTLNKIRVHTRPHHRLEYLPEYVAVTEPTVTIDRERRMIGETTSDRDGKG